MNRLMLTIGTMIFPLFAGCVAQAQDASTGDGRPSFLHPRDGSSISEQDEVFVLYSDLCGGAELDRDVAPVVSRENERIVVELTVRFTQLPFCFALPPPQTWAIALGALPKGNYEIERRVYQPSAPGTEGTLLSLLVNSVRVGDTPHPSISGTWFDPGVPGRGFFLTLIPAITNGEPQAVVFSATVDAVDDQPTWLLGLGRFDQSRLTLPLTLGGAMGEPQLLEFVYRGCGEMTYRDLAFSSFSYDLKQLTAVEGVEPCRPNAQILQAVTR